MTDVVREKNPNDLEALLATNYNGKIVRDIQTDVIAKIGENLGIRRFSRIETKGTKKLARYIHAGSKIGVIAVFDDPNGKLDDVTSYEVCMHVAAMHPQYVRSEDVPESIVAKEKEIMLAQMGDTNKPADILEKILSGKVAKFYTEVCLENQVYVRDPEGKATVGKWLSKIDAAIKIASFVRLQVGEGVEKQSG
jgi:elongation factor Ts